MNVQTFSPVPLWFNSGGPASRTRTERVEVTLLGCDSGTVNCPRAYRLGLEFADLEPVKAMRELLSAQGFSRPEELREVFAIPANQLIATPLPDGAPRLDVRTADPDQVLEQALMLGLCTSYLYDPARPVLWTTASLGRGLELFDPRGVYA